MTRLKTSIRLMSARLALLAVTVSATDLDISFPLGDRTNYVVRVHPPDLAIVAGDADALRKLGIDPAASTTYPVADASGDQYTCYLPKLKASIAESSEPRRDGRTVAIEAKLAAVRELFKPPHQLSRCLAKRKDFWSYLMCPGKSVRQFHGDVGAAAGRAGGEAGETQDAATGGGARNSLGAFVEDAVESAPSGLLYVQRFGAGSGGRRSTVRWSCITAPQALPEGVVSDVLTIAEPTTHAYELWVGTRDPAFCAAVPSNAALLAPLNGSVVRHVEGWWTYEITIGGAIRQFHAEANGREAAVSVIGVYDWAAGETLDAAALGHQPAIVQSYRGGSPCGVKGNTPRRARVRYECAPGAHESMAPASAVPAGATLGLVSIREPETCAYEITLTSSAACAHPDVTPHAATAGLAPQPPPADVHCFAHFDVSLETEMGQAALAGLAGAARAAGGAEGGSAFTAGVAAGQQGAQKA